MSAYRIVEHVVKVPRTDEWNQRTVSDVLYWIEGPGVCRPATDIEVDVWRQGAKDNVLSRIKVDADGIDRIILENYGPDCDVCGCSTAEHSNTMEHPPKHLWKNKKYA